MKWKFLPILLTVSMFVDAVISPVARAQQYGYGYPSGSCPYAVTASAAVTNIEKDVSGINAQITSDKAAMREAQKEARKKQHELDKLEKDISNVVDEPWASMAFEHMKNHYNCCKTLNGDTKVGAFFSEILDQSYAYNYPAAFEDSVQLATPVDEEVYKVQKTEVAKVKFTEQARMPAGGDCSSSFKKGKAAHDKCCSDNPTWLSCSGPVPPKVVVEPVPKPQPPSVVVTPPQPPVVVQPQPVVVPPATTGTTEKAGQDTISSICPTTPCPQPAPSVSTTASDAQSVCGGMTATKPPTCPSPDDHKCQACVATVLFNQSNGGSSGNSGRGFGPNGIDCAAEDKAMFTSAPFGKVCQSKGKIAPDLCTVKFFRSGDNSKTELKKCETALKSYAGVLKEQEEALKEAEELQASIDEQKSLLKESKKDLKEQLALDAELEATCPSCAAAKRAEAMRPSGLQMGLTAAASILGGFAAYKGAQAISNQNIEAGWPTSPYLAVGSIYPFAQAGISGIMGGVNGAYGCGSTIGGGGFPQGPYGQPYGSPGIYGQIGGAMGYPGGYGFPQLGGGLFNQGLGPWGQAGIGGFGGYNPYGQGFNPYGGFGGGIGIGGGIGLGGNPFGGGGFNPYGGIGGGFGGGLGGGFGGSPFGGGLGGGFGLGGAYNPYGGIGLGGFGGGLGGIGGLGGLGGGFGGGFGGLGGGINPQYAQQQIQYQIQQQQSQLQRYTAEQSLLQQYQKIQIQLQLLESGSGGLSTGYDYGISAGLNGFSPFGSSSSGPFGGGGRN